MSRQEHPPLTASALHLEKRSADEHRLWHGYGDSAVLVGRITYTSEHGWDALDVLGRRYLAASPFGYDDEAVERAHQALRRALLRRGHLADAWQTGIS